MGFRIEDILECIGKIESYTEGMDFRAFTDSNITIDAVLRNIEIIGEAANHIPDEVAALEKDIPWQQIRGMRNILAHEYFGADLETVWVTVTENIPPLVEPLERLLKRKGS
ncbi:MAG TPA: DUF86 domain-containing protein [Gammaproteobacteria bacterium]|jgi:uncharacterized protein with HEPN domain